MFHHTGENGFTCEVCNSKFNRKNRLLTHMLTVHAKSASNKKSKGKINLHNQHILIVKLHSLHSYFRIFTHSDFKCSVCDKAYSLKSTLSAHEKTHKIEEQNKCHICGKEFKLESAFKRHMQTKHPL